MSEQELKDWVDYLHERFIVENTDKHWNDLSMDDDGNLTWSEYLIRAYGDHSGRLLQ